ncbi:MAG: PfkB family carbohydrate kinase [Pseudomonadota bacterium]
MSRVLCVGHAVQDFVFRVPELPATARKHQASAFACVGGGPAATAAVAIARLGGEPLLAARLGDDAVAGLIEAELVGHGVDCAWLRRVPGCASSLSAVLLDAAGERMIVNYLDVRMQVAADWLPDPGALGCAAVLADSRWPEGALAALTAARAAGLPGVLDADRPVPAQRAVLAAASHLAFSHEALADFTGETDPVRALGLVSRGLDAWCCVTVGAEGVHVLSRGEYRHLPGHRVTAVDTLGAGDVWHGAFALALAEGAENLDPVRFASAAAALKVQRGGGRAGAPTRAEVDDFMASHPE